MVRQGVATDDDVPHLPRGRGLKLSGATMVRIAMTAGMLVVLLMMRQSCSDAVGKFVTSFDGSAAGSAAGAGGAGGSGAAATMMARPGTVDVPPPPPTAGSGSSALDDTTYVELHAGMTDDEVRAAIEQAKKKAHARDGVGSGVGSGNGSGNGSGSGTR